MTRKIIHLDLDAFFCAVEEQRNPELVRKPFAVGGQPNERGVVSSCSYAARKLGVRSAMPTRKALQICPKLIIITPDHHDYSRISNQVMNRLRQWTGLVEQISIDEAFLDLSDLPESGESLARRLQAEIRDEQGLPCSLGVAANKLVAKMATDFGKAGHHGDTPPCAITVVPSGKEAEFMAPLPVQALWGVGPKTAIRFNQMGISQIGDLARLSEVELEKLLGKMGHELYFRSRGIDDRPVVVDYEAKSISQEITFNQDVCDQVILEKTIRQLSEKVGQHLRQAKFVGKTIRIKLRWANFDTITRQLTLQQPTDQGEVIYQTTLHLFEENWKSGKFVRLIGVGVSGLETPVHQLSLWDTEQEKGRRLTQALDELKERYGNDAVSRGKLPK